MEDKQILYIVVNFDEFLDLINFYYVPILKSE
jgi:hypothetical protein